VYDLQTRRTAHEIGHNDNIIGRPCLTADGLFLLCSEYAPTRIRELVCRPWNPEATSTPVWSSPVWPNLPELPWNIGLVPLADGSQFATAAFTISNKRRVSVCSIRTGDVIQSREIGGFANLDLAVAPEDALFVARMTRNLHIWSTFNPVERPRVVTNEGRKHFTAIAFHPSGKYLAATSNDETVKFYDVATWTVAKVYRWEIGRMRSIAFSRDGMIAAAGGDRGEVVVWDLDL
jgi:WD40 repeat protein